MKTPCLLLLAAAPLCALPVISAEKADTAPAYANPTFANPDTPGISAGKPAPDVPNTVDIIFLQQLAMGGRAEVELGKLADQRSAVIDVDAFGKHMVKDHNDANNKLVSLARSAKVELPPEMDGEHRAAMHELSALRGMDFDSRYIEGQIKDHQKAVQLLVHEIGSGQHSGVRLFAAETLPKVMEHLETALTIHARLTGAAPPASEPPTP